MLFDKILVLGLDRMLDGNDSRLRPLDPATSADCEYLINRGVMLSGPASREELSTYVINRARAELAQEEPETLPDDWFDHLEDLQPRTRAGLLVSSANHPAGVIPYDTPMPAGAEFIWPMPNAFSIQMLLFPS